MAILSLYYVLAACFIALLAIALFLNVFGLPANWIILGLVLLWQLLNPLADLSLWYWLAAICLALAGEVLEFGLQYFKGKKYGSSSSGSWGGLLGAIVGAILMAPFLFGIGAFAGALAGAWTGCLLFELMSGRPFAEARQAAYGAMLGSLLGSICKIGAGAAIVALTAWHIWPQSAGRAAACLELLHAAG